MKFFVDVIPPRHDYLNSPGKILTRSSTSLTVQCSVIVDLNATTNIAMHCCHPPSLLEQLDVYEAEELGGNKVSVLLVNEDKAHSMHGVMSVNRSISYLSALLMVVLFACSSTC